MQPHRLHICGLKPRASTYAAPENEGIHLHDPVAVGWALAPELFSTEEFWIDVETTGELTSGQVVVDERRVDEAKRRGVLVRCLTGARVSDFLTLFSNLALGTSWPQGEARSSR